jgi:hypothetical protein
MYPTPPPSDERFDPVLYPKPWDNDPVPAEVLRLYPQSRHEETVIEPQNEDDQSIIDVPVDVNADEPLRTVTHLVTFTRRLLRLDAKAWSFHPRRWWK